MQVKTSRNSSNETGGFLCYNPLYKSLCRKVGFFRVSMRLAIMADIHGNLPAFEAALEHARQQGVDQMVISSPDSRDC